MQYSPPTTPSINTNQQQQDKMGFEPADENAKQQRREAAYRTCILHGPRIEQRVQTLAGQSCHQLGAGRTAYEEPD
jgi:hypothetical protein